MMSKASAAAIAMMATAVAPAWAQQQTGPAEQAAEVTSSEALAADIVVIGTKKLRGESVQRAPLAVTAYGAPQLEAKFFRDLPAIGRPLPNVQLIPVGTLQRYAEIDGARCGESVWQEGTI